MVFDSRVPDTDPDDGGDRDAIFGGVPDGGVDDGASGAVPADRIPDSVPDIGVLGRYTYLATELFWGSVAVYLLRRAGALRKAAATILALYPIAYAWDRYTLAVGVFDVELRTGIDVAGIPIEEHLFMAVVPGLVVGVHETLFGD